MGFQDAARKQTFPGQKPGPWADTVTHMNGGEVIGTVTVRKWRKTKLLVEEVEGFLLADSDALPLKRLLLIRGYLNYVVRTYPWLSPYLKGLHLTINRWRPSRDAKGYRLSGQAKRAYNLIREEVRDPMPCRRVDEEEDSGMSVSDRAAVEELLQDMAPKTVCAVQRLKSDVGTEDLVGRRRAGAMLVTGGGADHHLLRPRERQRARFWVGCYYPGQ